MKSKLFIVLAVAILLAAASLVLQGSTPSAVASPLGPETSVEMGGPRAPAQETTCTSCTDCSEKLASGDWVTVTLANNLNTAGGCIGIILGESDVVLDCAGHTIQGSGPVVDSASGIAMMHGSNNTIMNCTVSDFDRGIYLADATDHTVVNNTTESNGVGILLGSSNSNDIHDNTSRDNYTGISLENSDSNTFNTNVVCNNSVTDFNVDATSNGNTGDNNNCDVPDGWNDTGTTGCTSLCAGSTTCNSCADCTSKLDGSIFDKVVLTTDISNFAGTCVSFSASNLEFNCNGHTIDGDDSGTDYGVYVPSSSGNQVRNCTITDFYRGIYLNGASNGTLYLNTTDSNTDSGVHLYNASGNTIYFSDADSNGQYGFHLNASDSNTIYFNDLLSNPRGIRLYGSDSNTLNFNEVCSCVGEDFVVTGGSTGNSGDNNTCDATSGWNDTGATACTYTCDSDRCATCSDGVQNGDEEDVDCGGTYCPPCSQCTGQPSNTYAPADTVCNNKWPTSDGPSIGMNTSADSCDLVEVCDPNLDYIIEDALLCCEHSDYNARLTGSRASSKISACDYAHTQAYDGSFTYGFDPSTLKQCLAHYIIRSFDASAVYMQGYFHGEWCCYGHDDLCASGCSYWGVNPPAWEMGTTASCAGPGGATPDFQMGGHRCEYYWTWFFHTFRWGKDGYWNSDTNYNSNSDSVVDLPTHASVNRLSTGTCVDYSFALTTMLRKAGYSKDDVFSVNGDGHGYNLLRFPGESKWHYVDTVGNSGGGVYGGTGYADPETAWYRYCHNLDDGCSNDVYSQSRSHCPSNSSIYGCESVLMSSAAETMPSLITEVEVEPEPMWQIVHTVAVTETCTELNPCTEAYTTTVEPPGPVVDLDAYKVASSDEITPGEKVLISITLDNHETTSVDAIVRETFIPGMAYDLTAQEQSFESFTFEYHSWNVTVPPQSTHTLTFTASPEGLGYYTFAPTIAFVDGNAYETSSPIVEVVCDPDGTCDAGESHRFCPQDCTTGIQDDYCDMVWDGRIDPDCAYEMDPDYDPDADTDGDGVNDGSDDCPLTMAGETVDANGCACSQKICDDGDPATQDGCNAATAACEYVADTDQDGVPDGDDNCPNDYNPQQHDTDGDGTGDQCEIGPITADTTLDGGTYHIFDYELGGAVVISASNVTLDCNGAAISGDGTGYGIYVPGDVYSVTIQNCQISGYRYGIFVDGSGGHQLLDNTLQQNSFGIVLGSASDNTVSGNTASSNDQGGIYLEGSTGNQVSDNAIDSNGSLGLFIHTSSSNDISNNSVCGNTNGDFSVYESTNAGDGNTCDEPGDWSDAGETGCTHACGIEKIFLPVVLRNY